MEEMQILYKQFKELNESLAGRNLAEVGILELKKLKGDYEALHKLNYDLQERTVKNQADIEQIRRVLNDGDKLSEELGEQLAPIVEMLNKKVALVSAKMKMRNQIYDTEGLNANLRRAEIQMEDNLTRNEDTLNKLRDSLNSAREAMELTDNPVVKSSYQNIVYALESEIMAVEGIDENYWDTMGSIYQSYDETMERLNNEINVLRLGGVVPELAEIDEQAKGINEEEQKRLEEVARQEQEEIDRKAKEDHERRSAAAKKAAETRRRNKEEKERRQREEAEKKLQDENNEETIRKAQEEVIWAYEEEKRKQEEAEELKRKQEEEEAAWKELEEQKAKEQKEQEEKDKKKYEEELAEFEASEKEKETAVVPDPIPEKPRVKSKGFVPQMPKNELIKKIGLAIAGAIVALGALGTFIATKYGEFKSRKDNKAKENEDLNTTEETETITHEETKTEENNKNENLNADVINNNDEKKTTQELGQDKQQIQDENKQQTDENTVLLREGDAYGKTGSNGDTLQVNSDGNVEIIHADGTVTVVGQVETEKVNIDGVEYSKIDLASQVPNVVFDAQENVDNAENIEEGFRLR